MASVIMTTFVSMPAGDFERSGFLFRVATSRYSAWWCILRTAPTPRWRFGIESAAAVRLGQLTCRVTSAEFAASKSGMAEEIGNEAARNWYSMDGAEIQFR